MSVAAGTLGSMETSATCRMRAVIEYLPFIGFVVGCWLLNGTAPPVRSLTIFDLFVGCTCELVSRRRTFFDDLTVKSRLLSRMSASRAGGNRRVLPRNKESG